MRNENTNRIASRRRRRGFTLTEIAIVLGIIGLILGAIWVAAAAVYNNLRISHANTAVLQIAQGVRGLYATSNNTGTPVPPPLAFTDTIMCAKATPSDLTNIAPCTGAGTMIDMWPGGATTISSTTDGAGFAIEMSNVPQSSCMDLLVAVGGSTRDPGLFYIGTVATPVAGVGSSAAPTTDGAPLTAAVTPALATPACAAGATNVVAFGFSLKS